MEQLKKKKEYQLKKKTKAIMIKRIVLREKERDEMEGQSIYVIP
jgi:hypothetical protein